ncbi:flagellar protein FlaG [Pedomonas mirosovicensis]|uniref:flagellar protein FlaG n=1 Tax=Pedomonas mirosovicensis TaxID=2908641 RepID=UPI00216AA5B5|nr:flagellar protein FlaG [Pedomonas mirosovicensis]MCH8685087.1 flagellar protein FlaG [Pedomonas mirosovicensis]
MDRITLAGHGAPAAIRNGDSVAGVSRSSAVLPGDAGERAAARQHDGEGAGAARRSDAGLSPEEIQRRAVEVVRSAINEAGEAIEQNARLVIRKDEDTGRFIYEFRDPNTDELVRQFPAEEVLRALVSFRQAMTGKVLDSQA